MSLVPPRITTTFGFRSITSWRKRSTICGVVCPLMPRLKYGLPGKYPSGPSIFQPSVIESPMKTTRFSPAAGNASFKSASLYLPSIGQSSFLCSARWRSASLTDAPVAAFAGGATCVGAGAFVSGTFPGSCAPRTAGTSNPATAIPERAMR
jgi:hypothetical protein